MMTPWDALSSAITRLNDKVNGIPVPREATVVGVEPLALLFDTDTVPVLAHGTLEAGLVDGDRVLTTKLSHYIWVLGKRGGSGSSSLPAGSILAWGAAPIPTNWLECNGQAVSRTTYSDLFAIIGVQYGTGDGSTTFNLPDLRGRVPVGFSSSETEFNSLGKKYGTKTHTLTVAEIPSHSHRQYVTAPTGPGPGIRTSWTGDATSVAYDQGINTGGQGGGAAHNNVQPSFAVKFIIKASGGIGSLTNTVESVLLNRVAALESPPKYLLLSTTQSIGQPLTGAWGLLAGFNNTEEVGGFAYSAGVITVPSQGLIRISLNVSTNAPSTSVTSLALTKNRAAMEESANAIREQNTGNSASISWMTKVSAGDLIRMWVAGGGSILPSTQLSIEYLR